MNLPKKRIKKHCECASYEDAIHQACDLLKEEGIVNNQYALAAINAVKEHGPYFVIAPNIMMAHARPEEGALKNGLSFISLANTVDCEGVPVKYVFALSAVGDNQHIELIQALSDVLDNENIYEILEDSPESLESMFK